MTAKMNVALNYMRQAREERRGEFDPAHGMLSSESTFYDGEIHTAYVHWRTAEALKKARLIVYGDSDPEWGTELWLTEGCGMNVPPSAQRPERSWSRWLPSFRGRA